MPAFAELLPLAAILAVAGLAGGLLAGLLGVGGGIVIVPVLYHLLGVLGLDSSESMLVAVGTSLAAMIPTSLRSALAHHRRGAVDLDLLKLWVPPGLVAASLGVLVAHFIGGRALTAVFAIVALLAAANLAIGGTRWRIADALPKGIIQRAIAAAIAFVSVMMGIGGGTLSVPTLTLFGYPIHRAVGTSAGFGLAIAIPGGLGFMFGGPADLPFTIGAVNLLGVALIVPMTLISTPWGAALAHRLDARWLARAFALFLVATSVRMIAGFFD